MSGHTPGPWVISKRTGSVVSISGVGWGKFATVVVRLRGEPGNEEEGIANSRLIAAAPVTADAAEKLTALLAHIVEYSHYATDEDDPADILRRIENEAHELASAIGYDGTTIGALRAAGLP